MATQFIQRGSADDKIVAKIARRAAKMQREYGSDTPADELRLHHHMNVSACHASGNPLRLSELLEADDFNFAHDVFGIDLHLDRDTGELTGFFSPRYSARVAA